MLNNPNGALCIPEEAVVVNCTRRWGDAMNSTTILPSEESTSAQASLPAVEKRRRMGMGRLREMLKALRRSLRRRFLCSHPSASTESSIRDSHHSQHYYASSHIPVHRRTKTNIGSESARNHGKTALGGAFCHA